MNDSSLTRSTKEKTMKKNVAITVLIVLSLSFSATQASAAGFCQSIGKDIAVCDRR